jgi:hypothetical protein
MFVSHMQYQNLFSKQPSYNIIFCILNRELLDEETHAIHVWSYKWRYSIWAQTLDFSVRGLILETIWSQYDISLHAFSMPLL